MAAHTVSHPPYFQPVAVRKALRDAGLTMSEIDGIAFTRGPGEI